LNALSKLEEEFARRSINPQLIADSLDANEHSIDALSLCLLELLVARSKLPNSGAGYIQKRRCAISDATINYLVVYMLEALDRHGESIRIPASMVVLIREQLCGSRPDLLQTYHSRQQLYNAAVFAGQYCHYTNTPISVRRLAVIGNVGRSTAARWLADKDFQQSFEYGRKLAAEFQKTQGLQWIVGPKTNFRRLESFQAPGRRNQVGRIWDVEKNRTRPTVQQSIPLS
jgi:hypothetical protein